MTVAYLFCEGCRAARTKRSRSMSKSKPSHSKAKSSKVKPADSEQKPAHSHPHVPNTGSEEIPPGATRAAADRPMHRGGGAPGSGAGPRHAAGDEGSPEEEYGPAESN